jgi:hypothetical protein
VTISETNAHDKDALKSLFCMNRECASQLTAASGFRAASAAIGDEEDELEEDSVGEEEEPAAPECAKLLP